MYGNVQEEEQFKSIVMISIKCLFTWDKIGTIHVMKAKCEW